MLKLSSLIRLFGLAIASLVLTIACSQQPNTNSSNTNSPQSQPLVSATNNWVGLSGHHVAVGKNFFSEQGLKVQDLFFQSSSEEITAFLAGKVDLGWLTSGDAIQMIAKDPSIKIIYLVDYSNGSDGILGRGINHRRMPREKLLVVKIFCLKEFYCKPTYKKLA